MFVWYGPWVRTGKMCCVFYNRIKFRKIQLAEVKIVCGYSWQKLQIIFYTCLLPVAGTGWIRFLFLPFWTIWIWAEYKDDPLSNLLSWPLLPILMSAGPLATVSVIHKLQNSAFQQSIGWFALSSLVCRQITRGSLRDKFQNPYFISRSVLTYGFWDIFPKQFVTVEILQLF